MSCTNFWKTDTEFQCQTSCGFGVPLLSSESVPVDPTNPADDTEIPALPILKDRETLGHWTSKKIERDELQKYQAEWNADSLDGLPGLGVARRDRGERLWITGLKARVRRVALQREALGWGFVGGLLAMWIWRMLTGFLIK